MEEKILQLLVGLTADVRDMKTDIGDLKSDVGTLKYGLENLHTEMNTRFDLVDQRFDRVDNLLEGIGGQFEHQTEQRLEHDERVAEEFLVIKSRIFDLENKVNRAH